MSEAAPPPESPEPGGGIDADFTPPEPPPGLFRRPPFTDAELAARLAAAAQLAADLEARRVDPTTLSPEQLALLELPPPDPPWESVLDRHRRLARLGVPLPPLPRPANRLIDRRTAAVLSEAVTLEVTGTVSTGVDVVTVRRPDGHDGLAIRDKDGQLIPLERTARGWRIRSPQLPAVPPAFPNGTALVPSAFPLQAALASFHNAREAEGAWTRDEQGRPVYTFRQRQGTAFVTLAPAAGDAVPPDQAAREALWQQFKDLGDLDGDVLLAALAQWLRARDATGYAWVTAPAILDYRGVQPMLRAKVAGGKRYRHGHRVEDAEAVAACWSRLRLVYLHLENVEYREVPAGRQGRRGRPRTARYSLKTELIHVPDLLTQRQLDGREAAVAWRYRPGRWVEPYLEAPNQQLALLLQQALAYDPYRERWEKRLARYLFFHLRIKATAGTATPIRRNVGAVLWELGLGESFDQRNPERTVRRFDAAMDRLRADGQIGAWRLTPDAQRWWDTRPGRGWLGDWLGDDGRGGVAVMEVTPPAAARERYQALADRAQLAKQAAATGAAAQARKRRPTGGG